MTESDLNKLSTFHTKNLRRRLRIFWPEAIFKHRRFLSRQLNAIFVALKLQLQHRTCVNKVRFSARFVAPISQENRLCKRALTRCNQDSNHMRRRCRWIVMKKNHHLPHSSSQNTIGEAETRATQEHVSSNCRRDLNTLHHIWGTAQKRASG